MLKQVVFVGATPQCPCGSTKFDSTFQLLGGGEWRIEAISCLECDAEIEITEEFERWIRDMKWTVRKE